MGHVVQRSDDDTVGSPGPTGTSVWLAAAWGAVVAVVTAPLAAAIVASVYRFPIPFGEYARGIDEATNAAFASVFYLVLGGALLLGAGGAVAGALLARGHRLRRRVLALTAAASFGMALVAALILATLEEFVGTW